jgi:hypothetical protein
MDDYKNEQEWQTRLNDASWAATRSWDSEVMGPMTPKIFNNMKPLIKTAILNFLNSAPPKRPVKSYTGGEPQYATDAPRREWVGLTDEGIDDAWRILAILSDKGLQELRREYARAIEAKLRERNT